MGLRAMAKSCPNFICQIKLLVLQFGRNATQLAVARRGWRCKLVTTVLWPRPCRCGTWTAPQYANITRNAFGLN